VKLRNNQSLLRNFTPKCSSPATGPLPSGKQLQQEYNVGRDTVLHAVESPPWWGTGLHRARRGT